MNDKPIGYDVYREEDVFHLKPAIDSRSLDQPPFIKVFNRGSEWLIEGAGENDLIEQVKKIIQLKEMIVDLNVAS